MRRLPGTLLNAATVVSLFLALAVTVLWVRSGIGIADELLWNIRSPAERRSAGWDLRSGWGRVRWGWAEKVYVSRELFELEHPAKREHRPNTAPRGPGPHLFIERYPRTPARGTFWFRRGFEFARHRPAPVSPGSLPWTDAWVDVSVPHWLVLLAFAALPAVRGTRRIRAARRRHPGLCPSCGYDLRATPDRCPECGTIRA
jgi:hypothetical protein